jgi:signal transduction histidine kinase
VQLRQAQKMEAIGLLAGGVAHDFNNLLTVILGNAELSLSELQPADHLHRELTIIQRTAQRGAKLTRQLLAFSRRRALQAEPLQLNAHVADFSVLLARVLGVDIDLQLRLSSDVGTIWADAGALDQVLMNLAVNARDAMPTGGTLTIETTRVELDAATVQAQSARAMRPAQAESARTTQAESARTTRPAQARTRAEMGQAGAYVRLAVLDTGAGMDADAQAHLFEPFFTTKEVGKGTGLGLSVVYGIVEQHRGWIQVHSEVGQGTRFDIYLPAQSARTTQAEDGQSETKSER